jgi:hypothetical protein
MAAAHRRILYVSSRWRHDVGPTPHHVPVDSAAVVWCKCNRASYPANPLPHAVRKATALRRSMTEAIRTGAVHQSDTTTSGVAPSSILPAFFWDAVIHPNLLITPSRGARSSCAVGLNARDRSGPSTHDTGAVEVLNSHAPHVSACSHKSSPLVIKAFLPALRRIRPPRQDGVSLPPAQKTHTLS